MTAIEKLVAEFEHRLWDMVGTYMKKSTLNSAIVSYAAEYLTYDQSGVILFIATKNDTLRISFLKGKHSSIASEIYCTPEISNYNKAEQALNQMKEIIEHSVYGNYEMSIEDYAESFQKSFIS